jgi:SAM-dependent methyltransferase
MRIDRRRGRRLFGRDPAEFDRVRPDYPDRVYRVLEDRCGLSRGTATFEIGPGTGKATRELLRRGASPLVVVEPDPRLARFLRRSLGAGAARVRIVRSPFESAVLPAGAFDLGVAATSFHWLNERRSLRKVARLLRPGGWWAAWWSRTGDPLHPSAFGRAVDPLFDELPGRRSSRLTERAAFERERERRRAALRDVGLFDRVRVDTFHWTRVVDTETLVGLHRTFSNISTLPRAIRERFLARLERIADDQFAGRVALRMVVTLFTARRR